MQRPNLSATPHFIAWHARHAPQAAAVVEHGVQVTYAGLAARLGAVVRALAEAGVRPGALIGVEISERFLHLLVLLGCEALGAASVSLSAGDISAGTSIARRCDLILARTPQLAPGDRVVGVPLDWPNAVPMGTDEDLRLLTGEVASGRLARIIYTSGTTGAPKALPITVALHQTRIDHAIERLPAEIAETPRMLCLYKPGMGGMYTRICSVLQLGGTVVFGPEEHVAGMIAAGAVNLAVLTAGDLERLVQAAASPPAGHRLHVVVFGAAVPAWLGEATRRQWQASIDNPYAAGETNPIAMLGDDGSGPLCPGVEVRIVDAAGQEHPPGATGLIRVRSDTMVHGYFDDPALTAASFIDGWYQTSDIGCMPEPGRLIVLGRADDMLNIGGVKVPPGPIEASVKRLAGVRDAIVLSVSRTHGLAMLLVAVELDAAQMPDGLRQSIGDIASAHVRHFEVLPLPWFPRTETGKVRRVEIEAIFWRSRPNQPAGNA